MRVRQWRTGWVGWVTKLTDLFVFAVGRDGVERFFVHEEASYNFAATMWESWTSPRPVVYLEPSFVFSPYVPIIAV